jgi:S-(hydroxymethyl)glutathione dehydrogenase/alcohol dehydrogenase
MRAAVLYHAQKPMVIEDLTLDEPKRGEVRVRIKATGICHSDYHVIDGSWHGRGYPLPMVLGHEAAGVVEAVGPGVTLVQSGDHCVLSFVVSCGRCRYCVAGQPHLCDGLNSPVGTAVDGTYRVHKGDEPISVFGRMGSFAERVVIHESQAIPIRKDMPWDTAALIGCATMTGVGAVLNTAEVEPGATMAVFATGGVGLNVIQGGTLVNASQIIGVDLLDNKLEYARKVGATHVVNSSQEDPVKAIKELTGGRGVDYAFDAIGLPKVSRQAYDATRRGGTTVIVGMAPTGAEIPIPGTIPGDAKTVKGCFYGSTRPAIDFPKLVDLYLQGRLKLDQIVSRTYRFDEINDAFDALARGDNARGVVVFED